MDLFYPQITPFFAAYSKLNLRESALSTDRRNHVIFCDDLRSFAAKKDSPVIGTSALRQGFYGRFGRFDPLTPTPLPTRVSQKRWCQLPVREI
ncbi:hypothetical protein [Candidatus Thiosymbion oneisti]|uniref:hypothetical protein n=1 Tax=Candidatus Thiosymbion oneisti TaxID=589554 RepID=UPI0013FE39D3|nr:hypothetical protein [Candidatus Thiosymbion oneisti]